MRFEKMNTQSQQAFLKRLYNALNKELFDDKLNGVYVGIVRAGDRHPHDASGWYNPSTIRLLSDGTVITGNIIITQEYIEETVIPCKYQWHQICTIACILIHEMIHEYCYENNIDDNDHNEQLQAEARKRYLNSIYEDGIQTEEWLDPFFVSAFLKNIRIK